MHQFTDRRIHEKEGQQQAYKGDKSWVCFGTCHIIWIDMSKFGSLTYLKRSIPYLKGIKMMILRGLCPYVPGGESVFVLEGPGKVSDTLEPGHMGNIL